MARGSANNATKGRTRSTRKAPAQEIEEQQTDDADETKPATRGKNVKKSNKANNSEAEGSGENKMEVTKKNQPAKAVGRKRKVENIDESTKETLIENETTEKRSARRQSSKSKPDVMEESSQVTEVDDVQEDVPEVFDESSQNQSTADSPRRTRSSKIDEEVSEEPKDIKQFKTKGKKIQIEIKTSIVDDTSRDSTMLAKGGPFRKARRTQNVSESASLEEKESIIAEVNIILSADKSNVKGEVDDESGQDLSGKPVKSNPARKTRSAKKAEETNVEQKEFKTEHLIVKNETTKVDDDKKGPASLVKTIARKTRNTNKNEVETTGDSSKVTKIETGRRTRGRKKKEANVDTGLKDSKGEDMSSSFDGKDILEHATPDIHDDNSLDSITSNQSGTNREGRYKRRTRGNIIQECTVISEEEKSGLEDDNSIHSAKTGKLRRTRKRSKGGEVGAEQNTGVEIQEKDSVTEMSTSNVTEVLLDENVLTEKSLTENISEKQMDGNWEDVSCSEVDKEVEHDENKIMSVCTDENVCDTTEVMKDFHIKTIDKTERMVEDNNLEKKDYVEMKILDKSDSVESGGTENVAERGIETENIKADGCEFPINSEDGSLNSTAVTASLECEEAVPVQDENILNPEIPAEADPSEHIASHQGLSLQSNDEFDASTYEIATETVGQPAIQVEINGSDNHQNETEAESIEDTTVTVYSEKNIDHGYSAIGIAGEKSEKANVDLNVCSEKTEEASVVNFEIESSSTDSNTGNLVIEENFQDNIIEGISSELPPIKASSETDDENQKANLVDIDNIKEIVEERGSGNMPTPDFESYVDNVADINLEKSKSLDAPITKDTSLTATNSEMSLLSIEPVTKDSTNNVSSEDVNETNVLQDKHSDYLACAEETEGCVRMKSVGKSSDDISVSARDAGTNGVNTFSDAAYTSLEKTETPTKQHKSSPDQTAIDSSPEGKSMGDGEKQRARKKRRSSSYRDESPDIEISKAGKRIVSTYEISSNVGESAQRNLAGEGEGRSEGSIGIKIKRKRVEERESEDPSGGTGLQAQQLFADLQSQPGPSGTQQVAKKSLRKRKRQDTDQERENSAAPIRRYLEKFVPFLLEGLLKITYTRPADPIQYLADWMQDNKDAAYSNMQRRAAKE